MPDEIEAEARGGGFGGLAEVFLQKLEALRDLLVEMGPKVAELDKTARAIGDSDRVLAGITRDERLRLGLTLQSERERLQRALARAEKSRSPEQSREATSFSGLRDFVLPVAQRVIDEFRDRAWVGRFVMQFVRSFTRPARLPIFLESLVISSVSSFEGLGWTSGG
jgi:hypothetical protein